MRLPLPKRWILLALPTTSLTGIRAAALGGQHCRNPHKREDGEGAHADRGVQMAPEAVTAASKTIAHEFGEEYLPENPRFYSAKAKNAQGA